MSVKSSKLSSLSLKKCIMAVPRNTPPANCVPTTKNPSFHFIKHGDIPAANVPTNTRIRHHIFTRSNGRDVRLGFVDGEPESASPSAYPPWAEPEKTRRRRRRKRRERGIIFPGNCEHFLRNIWAEYIVIVAMELECLKMGIVVLKTEIVKC